MKNSTNRRKWPQRLLAAGAVMALAWWWIAPPAEAWHSGAKASTTCEGWSIEVSGYSPETMEMTHEPAQAGSWVDGEDQVTITVTVAWSDYHDVQTHVVVIPRPVDCEAPPIPPEEETAPPVTPGEEPPVLIPPAEEWRTPPPTESVTPPATPATPRRGQPVVTG